MKRSVLLSTFLFAAVLSPMLLQTNYCDLEKYQKLATLELYVPDINGQNVISDFNPDGILYKVELPVDPPDTAVLLVQAQDATATIEVTYDSLPISLGPNGVAPLTLAPNHSEIKVAVRGDSKAWTYTVSIDRVDYCPCDDGNACTYDICMPADQVCVYRAVPDGTLCEGIRGGCYGGVCNFVPVSVAHWSEGSRVRLVSRALGEDFDLPDCPAKLVRAEDGELVLFANNAPTYYRKPRRRLRFVAARVRSARTSVRESSDAGILREPRVALVALSGGRELARSASTTSSTRPSRPPATESTAGTTRSPTRYRRTMRVRSSNPRLRRTSLHPLPPCGLLLRPNTDPRLVRNGLLHSDQHRARVGRLLLHDIQPYGLGVSEVAFQCAMRTNTLDDPTSWRAWDWERFHIAAAEPICRRR